MEGEKVSSIFCTGTVRSGSKIVLTVAQNKMVVVHYATVAVFPGTGGLMKKSTPILSGTDS